MDHSILNGIIVLLTLSVVSVAMVRRLNLPPILGYLAVGVLFGEHAIGWIPAHHDIEFLAELGVVFLLFMIGLEVSIGHLMSMRRLLLGLGSMQVLLSTLSTIALAMWISMSWQAAFAVGGALALSSTAIAVKQLQEQLEIHSRHGRNSLGILLFQDLSVVPFLVAIPILASGSDQMGVALGIAFIKAVIAFGIMFAIGHWLLRPLLNWIAGYYSAELFTLAILLLALTAAWSTQQMGLSLALGAFLAGVMLAESEYRHHIEIEIRPFRDVLLGLFFISVGAQLNVPEALSHWQWVLLLTLGVVVGKGGLIVFLTWFLQRDWGVALRTGIVLGQGGEFGFALLTLALANNIVSSDQIQPILAALVLSMSLAPLLIRHNGAIAKRVVPDYQSQRDEKAMAIAEHADNLEDHVIIAGFGRVGQNLAQFLKHEEQTYLALDVDPRLIKDAFDAGEPVRYGDSTHPQTLEMAGIHRAAALVITVHEGYVIERVLEVARSLNQKLPIIVRVRNEQQMEKLLQMGASTVIPESLESSLLVATRTLEHLDIDRDEIDLLISSTRSKRYADLRGIFHGEPHLIDQPLNDYLMRETFVIEDNCSFIGQRLSQLGLNHSYVDIELIRNEENTMLVATDPLAAGDRLILTGTNKAVERARKALQSQRAIN